MDDELPMATEVAPLRWVPVNKTVVPLGPMVGLKPVMVGSAGPAVTLRVAHWKVPVSAGPWSWMRSVQDPLDGWPANFDSG